MSEIPKLFALGTLLFALVQAPVQPVLSIAAEPRATASVVAGKVETKHEIAMAEEFFGSDVPQETVRTIVNGKKEFVSTRQAYQASLAVVQKHSSTIRRKASEKGVPEDVALGVALLENGGSETAKSPAGALGVFQLMPATARSLGLKVNKQVDERRNPEMNIEGGITYLKRNYDRFGDWGLSTWAYHAGEGNVAKALQLYARRNHGIELPGIKDSASLRGYVEKHGITIHKLLSDPAVKNFTKRLNDDSHGYPYKVVATAALFSEASETKASLESVAQTKEKRGSIRLGK